MRSTIHQQNSPPRRTSLIARYCLPAVVLVALLGPLAQKGRGDSVLVGDEQWTIYWRHDGTITLRDRSHLSIVSGGRVDRVEAYDSSTVDVSGGEVRTALVAHNSNIVNISGGFVNAISASVERPSSVNISGGRVDQLSCRASWGIVVFYGQAFHTATAQWHARAPDGSWGAYWDEEPRIEGNRVLLSGYLGGEWWDGTPWTSRISDNWPSATILVSRDGQICSQWISGMDFNGDCKVNFVDFAIMTSPGLEYTTTMGRNVVRGSYADLNGDCRFDFRDWILFAQNWLQSESNFKSRVCLTTREW